MITQTQRKMEVLYSLPQSLAAENFLLERQQVVEFLGENHPFLFAEEVVLASGEGEDLEIGIFFNPDILKNLDHLNTHQRLNLVEGISHFLLFIYKHAEGIPLTKLELELQAEIDKFLMLVLDPDTAMHYQKALHFLDTPVNLPNLTHDQKFLYQQSFKLARRYSHYLGKKFFDHHSMDSFLAEVRTFYRLPYDQKMNFILNL